MPAFNQIGTAQVVGAGGAASIDFTSIPATYTDLLVKIMARSDAASAYNDCYLQFNGSTTNYSARSINGDGSSASSNVNSGAATSLRWSFVPGANATASTFGNAEIYIPNYTISNNKSVSADGVTENNGGAYMTLRYGLWSDTAAINAIRLFIVSANFAQYSTAYLYGISNA